jgi:hypothetical protein
MVGPAAAAVSILQEHPHLSPRIARSIEVGINQEERHEQT